MEKVISKKMPSVLTSSFFGQDALVVAKDLIGKFIVRKNEGCLASAMITETEAYIGPNDRACHAFRGHTKRNDPLYGPPGIWYVYFCYGMHWMLNVVTREEGFPSGVLIRGVEGVVGPGRVTRFLGVTGKLSSKPVSISSGMWIEDRGVNFSDKEIKRCPRIGVDYAGIWAKKPYRFLLV